MTAFERAPQYLYLFIQDWPGGDTDTIGADTVYEALSYYMGETLELVKFESRADSWFVILGYRNAAPGRTFRVQVIEYAFTRGKL